MGSFGLDRDLGIDSVGGGLSETELAEIHVKNDPEITPVSWVTERDPSFPSLNREGEPALSGGDRMIRKQVVRRWKEKKIREETDKIWKEIKEILAGDDIQKQIFLNMNNPMYPMGLDGYSDPF